MIQSLKWKYPDLACRARYTFLSRESRHKGLDLKELKRSENELTELINGIYYLKTPAYKPTGLALGSPLPSISFTKRLFRLSCLINNFLIKLFDTDKTFAFVPPESYHITLLNHSHFDCSNDITRITEYEVEKARKIFAQVNKGSIILHFNSLILTPHGRLIVPGFPSDDSLYEFRSSIKNSIPELGVNAPNTAHIKLGHVLVIPNTEELKIMLGKVALCGEHVSARLNFTNVYSPVGRIKL